MEELELLTLHSGEFLPRVETLDVALFRADYVDMVTALRCREVAFHVVELRSDFQPAVDADVIALDGHLLEVLVAAPDHVYAAGPVRQSPLAAMPRQVVSRQKWVKKAGGGRAALVNEV